MAFVAVVQQVLKLLEDHLALLGLEFRVLGLGFRGGGFMDLGGLRVYGFRGFRDLGVLAEHELAISNRVRGYCKEYQKVTIWGTLRVALRVAGAGGFLQGLLGL